VTIRSELTTGEPASLDSADKHHITKEKIARFYRSSKLLMENIVGFPVWVKDSLSRVRCTQLRWETRVGIGDAPETAMTTGLLWGVKSSLLGFLFSSMQIETKPKVLVEPQYNQMQFSTEFACIVKIRVGHAMVAGLLLLFRILRVKGGLRTWQSILFKA
jgi:hypothetical protein